MHEEAATRMLTASRMQVVRQRVINPLTGSYELHSDRDRSDEKIISDDA